MNGDISGGIKVCSNLFSSTKGYLDQRTQMVGGMCRRQCHAWDSEVDSRQLPASLVHFRDNELEGFSKHGIEIVNMLTIQVRRHH